MSHFQAVCITILVTLLLSIAGVVTRHLDSAPSFEVTFWRSAFCAVFLIVTLTLLRGRGLWCRLFHAPKIIWASGICWSVMITSFMMGITLTTVANVLIIISLAPLVTALFAYFFLHHRLPVVTWFAIFTVFLGITWIFLHGEENTFYLLGSLIAFTIPLAAASNYTILHYVLRLQNTDDSIDNSPANDMQQSVLIGVLISAIVTLPLAWPLQASIHDLGLLSLLGVFQLGLPCLLLVWASKELSAPEISLLIQLEVVFGVAWAWLWGGESLSVNTLIGGGLVLGALTTNELSRMYHEFKIRSTSNSFK